MVARRLVLAQPERVDALVLMDTSPGRRRGIDPDLVELAAPASRSTGLDVLRQLLDEADTCSGRPPYQRVSRERPGYVEFIARKWARSRRRCGPRSRGR